MGKWKSIVYVSFSLEIYLISIMYWKLTAILMKLSTLSPLWLFVNSIERWMLVISVHDTTMRCLFFFGVFFCFCLFFVFLLWWRMFENECKVDCLEKFLTFGCCCFLFSFSFFFLPSLVNIYFMANLYFQFIPWWSSQ